MQISSNTPPAKRVRAKVKTDAATPTITLKKPRSRKQPAAPVVEAEIEVVAMNPDVVDVVGMIATTAYFIAAERNFAPGQELDDWLEAERRIRSHSAG